MTRNTSGLKPCKPGEVRNPKGINQYTYRARAEEYLDHWCKEHGRELIERLLDDAKRGEPYAMKLALERILPATVRHEVELPTTTDADLEAVLDRFLLEVGATRPDQPTNGNGATAP